MQCYNSPCTELFCSCIVHTQRAHLTPTAALYYLTLRMQHTASIESSSDVVLLEADATSGQSHTVMKRSSNVVEQGIGKRHFRLKNIATSIFRLVVPKRSKRMYNYVCCLINIIIYMHYIVDEFEGEMFYSARLYKMICGFKVLAVFCVCPEHPIYTKVFSLREELGWCQCLAHAFFSTVTRSLLGTTQICSRKLR
jgi:hypothetical protein